MTRPFLWSVSWLLPWPPSALSPNRRQHWAALAKAKRRYRATCETATRLARVGPLPIGDLHIAYEFCPPTRRTYDRDNLVARMKAAQDGIADALGINDSRFASLSVRMGGRTTGGSVRVTVSGDGAAF